MTAGCIQSAMTSSLHSRLSPRLLTAPLPPPRRARPSPPMNAIPSAASQHSLEQEDRFTRVGRKRGGRRERRERLPDATTHTRLLSLPPCSLTYCLLTATPCGSAHLPPHQPPRAPPRSLNTSLPVLHITVRHRHPHHASTFPSRLHHRPHHASTSPSRLHRRPHHASTTPSCLHRHPHHVDVLAHRPTRDIRPQRRSFRRTLLKQRRPRQRRGGPKTVPPQPHHLIEVQGPGRRIENVGIRILAVEIRGKGFGCMGLGLGVRGRIQGLGLWVLGFVSKV